MIREGILQRYPDLFGTKKVNGREINVEQTIATLTQELMPEIATALTARRALLQSSAPVREKYSWPKWDDTFQDPVTGQVWTFRQIVQGLIDNFLRSGQRLALAVERRSTHPERCPPADKSRLGAHRAVESAGHGLQCAE